MPERFLDTSFPSGSLHSNSGILNPDSSLLNPESSSKSLRSFSCQRS